MKARSGRTVIFAGTLFFWVSIFVWESASEIISDISDNKRSTSGCLHECCVLEGMQIFSLTAAAALFWKRPGIVKMRIEHRTDGNMPLPGTSRIAPTEFQQQRQRKLHSTQEQVYARDNEETWASYSVNETLVVVEQKVNSCVFLCSKGPWATVALFRDWLTGLLLADAGKCLGSTYGVC